MNEREVASFGLEHRTYLLKEHNAKKKTKLNKTTNQPFI